MFLAWLAAGEGQRRFRGDPLTLPETRDWAVRDYRRWLLRDRPVKRSVVYANSTLTALDDFYLRLRPRQRRHRPRRLPRTAPAPSMREPGSAGFAP